MHGLTSTQGEHIVGWQLQGSLSGRDAGFSEAEMHLTLILWNKLFCCQLIIVLLGNVFFK